MRLPLNSFVNFFCKFECFECVYKFIALCLTYRWQVYHSAVSPVSATCKLQWIFESAPCAVLKQGDFVMVAMNFVVFSFHVIFWLNDFPSVNEAMTLVCCPLWPTHYINPHRNDFCENVKNETRYVMYGTQVIRL